MIRRVIDDGTLMAALTFADEVDTDDLREIVPALQEFTQAVATYLSADPADVESARRSLAEKATAAEKLAIDMREDRGQHLTDGRSQTPLGRLRRLAEGVVKDVSRLIEATIVTAAAQQNNQQTERSTLAALGSGQAKHLMITPRPGTREALGAGQLYPDTVSPADRMQLALPAGKGGAGPFTNLTLTGARPPVLDVLAIGGGHGGVNATFEPDDLRETAFSKDNWKQTVVAPLVAKGMRARPDQLRGRLCRSSGTDPVLTLPTRHVENRTCAHRPRRRNSPSSNTNARNASPTAQPCRTKRVGSSLCVIVDERMRAKPGPERTTGVFRNRRNADPRDHRTHVTGGRLPAAGGGLRVCAGQVDPAFPPIGDRRLAPWQ